MLIKCKIKIVDQMGFAQSKQKSKQHANYVYGAHVVPEDGANPVYPDRSRGITSKSKVGPSYGDFGEKKAGTDRRDRNEERILSNFINNNAFRPQGHSLNIDITNLDYYRGTLPRQQIFGTFMKEKFVGESHHPCGEVDGVEEELRSITHYDTKMYDPLTLNHYMHAKQDMIPVRSLGS